MRPFSLTLLAVLLAALGCSEPRVSDNPYLVDPEKTKKQVGGTDDIYDATQFAINSLLNSSRLPREAGTRVTLGKIVNRTGIPDYDERVIYNRFLSSFINGAGDRLIFLNREAVEAERSLQETGQVAGSTPLPTKPGADLVLDIELRQSAGAQTKTIQYSFALTNLAGELMWQDSKEIVKRR